MDHSIAAEAKGHEGERARPLAELTSSRPLEHREPTDLEGPDSHPRLSPHQPLQHGTQQPAIGT